MTPRRLVLAWLLATVAAAPLCPHAQAASPRGWIVDPRTGCRAWNEAPTSDESISWDGPCVNGLAHGNGTLRWFQKGSPTARHQGEFVGGVAEGYGIATYPSGNRYEGNWHEGQRHGLGTFTWPGQGRYEGEWLRDNREGRGVFTQANGDRYEGEFRNDKENGRGESTWGNGNRYDGQFRDGRAHGLGLMTTRDGQTFNGMWKDGCFAEDDRVAMLGATEEECKRRYGRRSWETTALIAIEGILTAILVGLVVTRRMRASSSPSDAADVSPRARRFGDPAPPLSSRDRVALTFATVGAFLTTPLWLAFLGAVALRDQAGSLGSNPWERAAFLLFMALMLGTHAGFAAVSVCMALVYAYVTRVLLRSVGFRPVLRYVFCLLAVPVFLVLFVVNLALTQGYLPALFDRALGGSDEQVAALASLPLPVFACLSWYWVFAGIDRLLSSAHARAPGKGRRPGVE
jgi:hypothetical protein